MNKKYETAKKLLDFQIEMLKNYRREYDGNPDYENYLSNLSNDNGRLLRKFVAIGTRSEIYAAHQLLKKASFSLKKIYGKENLPFCYDNHTGDCGKESTFGIKIFARKIAK